MQLDYGRKDNTTKDWKADYAAFLILPKEKGKDGMDSVVTRLMEIHTTQSSRSQRHSVDAFDEILEEINCNNCKVQLNVPRFKMQYGTKSLVDNLRSLGLQTCFDDNSMLMEMSDDPLVHLDEVLHKAVIEVTEEGTEAAAATVGIVMTRSAFPLPPPRITFDRPFVMLILHLPTKTPLFIARVDDPELH